MAPDEVRDLIQELLNIQSDITLAGLLLKCWVPATDGPGLEKRYLAAGDCADLAAAFSALADSLK